MGGQRMRLHRVWRLSADTVVGVLLLALLGAVLGPRWDPQPWQGTATADLPSTTQIVPQSTASSVPPAAVAEGANGPYAVHQQNITISLSTSADPAAPQIGALVYEPVGAEGPLPAVVFVHGAGTGSSQVAFIDQAKSLASHGVVALVPDKRLDTYTTTHRDYVAMARDYQQSVLVARSWPTVDPDRVGVYAESEGCWVAPVMAAADAQIAFVILASAPVVTPRQQGAYATDNYLRNTHVPTGVLRVIPRILGMRIPGDFDYIDFDVSPYQQQMRQPTLVVYGTADASMPMGQGAEQILADLQTAQNTDVTVRFYAGANHGLHRDGETAPEFLRDLSTWVVGLPSTAAVSPQISGAAVNQRYQADAVPTPTWLVDGKAMLWTMLGALCLIIAGAIAIFWRRRNKGVAPGLNQAVLWWSALTIVTWVGLLGYLRGVGWLALNYRTNDLLVTGGWLLVRALGVAGVAWAVIFGRRALQHLRESRPLAHRWEDAAALTSVAFPTLVLMVLLAYWGVYQLGV